MLQGHLIKLAEFKVPPSVREVIYLKKYVVVCFDNATITMYKQTSPFSLLLIARFSLGSKCFFKRFLGKDSIVVVDCSGFYQVLDLSRSASAMQTFSFNAANHHVGVANEGIFVFQWECLNNDMCSGEIRKIYSESVVYLELSLHALSSLALLDHTNVTGEITVYNDYASLTLPFRIHIANAGAFPTAVQTHPTVHLPWSHSLSLPLTDFFGGANLNFTIITQSTAASIPRILYTSCNLPCTLKYIHFSEDGSTAICTKYLDMHIYTFNTTNCQYQVKARISFKSIGLDVFITIKLLFLANGKLILWNFGIVGEFYGQNIVSVDINTHKISILYSETPTTASLAALYVAESSTIGHVLLVLELSGLYHLRLQWKQEWEVTDIQDLSWEGKYGLTSLGSGLINGSFHIFALDEALNLLVFEVQKEAKLVRTIRDPKILSTSHIHENKLITIGEDFLTSFSLPDLKALNHLPLQPLLDHNIWSIQSDLVFVRETTRSSFLFNISSPLESFIIAEFHLIQPQLINGHSMIFCSLYVNCSIVEVQTPYLEWDRDLSRSDESETAIVILANNEYGQARLELLVKRYNVLDSLWQWALTAVFFLLSVALCCRRHQQNRSEAVGSRVELELEHFNS